MGVHMRRLHLVFVVVAGIIAIPGGSIGAAPLEPRPQTPVLRQQMCDKFRDAVEQYAQLHRRLESPLPADIVSPDVGALFAPRAALAREIKKARGAAQQGEIFTPPVAVYFRVVIAETLRKTDLLRAFARQHEPAEAPVVNGPYPVTGAFAQLPPPLLEALPALPPEVRYGLMGRTLILWDVHAGLIVDFVPQAVPVLVATLP
jgi:hypothetical protein